MILKHSPGSHTSHSSAANSSIQPKPEHFTGVNRCVRLSWLCGFDKYLGKSFEHRKSRVEARILELGNIFACGIHAWVDIRNHLHIVVHMSVRAD